MRELLIGGFLICVASCAQSRDGSDPAVAGAGLDVFVTAQTLSIGSIAGAEPFLFGGVSDAHRLSDGRIVVADCQAGELRYFDQDGDHLRTVGAIGRGPGEFNWLTRIFPMGGDTIGVFDQLLGRISVFSSGGDFVRSFNAGGVMSYLVKGAIGSGPIVGIRTDRPSDPEVGAVFRAPQTVLLVDRTGAIVDSIGPLPGPELGATERGTRSVRLGREGTVSVSSAGLAYSVADAAGPLVFDRFGDDSTRVAPISIPGPTTEQDQERWQATYDSRGMAPEGGVFPAYSGMYSDSLPVHGDMYLDQDGGLWLQDPELPWDYPLKYTRYVEGAARMRVELPPRFFPFELHPDGILGVSFDENNVERIQVLTLVPGDTQTVARPASQLAPTSVPRCGYWASR